jgi:murein tripeptide amidase MpaA
MRYLSIVFCAVLVLFSFFSITSAQKDPMLVKVFLPTPEKVEQFKGLNLTLATHRITDHAQCFVIPEQLKLLQEMGLEFEVLVPPEKMKEYLFGKDGIIDPEYHTYWETVVELDSLADLFPNITRLDSIGQSTRFGYTIWCLKISDNPDQDEDEPKAMFNGMHHGSEALGNEVCLGLIKYLLTNYETDPQVTNWVDNIQIYIIPIVNPEGYVITADSSWYWRKNCRDNNENGILDGDDGVDLNRNYDFYWEQGGSGNPDWPNYRGPYPFSELETRALRDLGLEERFVFSISYHTY